MYLWYVNGGEDNQSGKQNALPRSQPPNQTWHGAAGQNLKKPLADAPIEIPFAASKSSIILQHPIHGAANEEMTMVTLLVATTIDPASINPANELLAMPGWSPGPSLQVFWTYPSISTWSVSVSPFD